MERGQAVTEFLIAALTILFVLLGTLQLALVLNAHSAVRFAAFSAARTAIVTGADHDKMVQSARIALLPIFPRHGRSVTVQGFLENLDAAQQVDQYTGWSKLNGTPITSVSLTRGKSGTITFDDPNDAKHSAITVTVTHQYELIIPLVNAIVWQVVNEPSTVKGGIDSAARAAAKDKKYRGRMDSGYRIPISASYTMHLQSDLEAGR